MSKSIEIQESKKVFVAWTNTDLTEGKGHQVPLHVCYLESTAKRLGKKGYVMGSPCPVEEQLAIKVGGTWLAPCVIVRPTKKDMDIDLVSREKIAAIEKARKLGLSDFEIEALSK